MRLNERRPAMLDGLPDGASCAASSRVRDAPVAAERLEDAAVGYEPVWTRLDAERCGRRDERVGA